MSKYFTLQETASSIKCFLELAHDCFDSLDWTEKKEIFGTDCMQNKMYEISKVIECLDKYLKLQASLNEVIDNSFIPTPKIYKDSDGRETEGQ